MPLIGYFKGQPNEYVIKYSSGRITREGQGLAFFYLQYNTQIVAVPTSSMDANLVFNEVTSSFSTSRISRFLRWQGLANSSTSPKMTCGGFLHHGGTYAQVHQSPDTCPSLPLCRCVLPAALGLPTPWKSYRRDPLDGPLRRGGPHLLDLRDLPAPRQGPPRGDLCQRPLCQPVLARGAQTPCQRLLRCPLAQVPSPPSQAAAPRLHRSDPAPLLWRVCPRQPPDLPQSGQ